jgi:subtilisin family serine protease
VDVKEDFDNVSSHATSVALIIGSNGSADHRGMAPNIELHSYKSSGAAGEMQLSGLPLSSHSYSQNHSSWGEYVENEQTGSELFDKVIRNNGIITFVSAGNYFDDKAKNGTGYGSVKSPATAKNTITVGATRKDQFDELAGFSSAGPTSDGRLKPEIVAPGYAINLEPNPYPDQDLIYGTSFACPVVSGSSALVLEQWRKNHPEDMLPSTMKALLVHTANNDGNGPTFRSGYGMLDTQEAVELVVLDEYNKHKL